MYHTPEAKAAAKARDKRKYAESERGRAIKVAYRASPGYAEMMKAAYIRYRQTPGYRAAQERYGASQKGKRTEARYRQWASETQPIRIKARAAVAIALRSGRIDRPECCDDCGIFGIVPDAHHWAGYQEPNWLDVEWLCRRCHKRRHLEPLT